MSRSKWLIALLGSGLVLASFAMPSWFPDYHAFERTARAISAIRQFRRMASLRNRS